MERALEGKPVYLAEHGQLNFTKFKKELIAYDEFFSLLRQRSVSHLGQVQLSIIETNGTISVYYSFRCRSVMGVTHIASPV